LDISSRFQMERSRTDIRRFYEWLGYTWGEHISEWMALFGDRKDASVHRVCIIAPRDHSKSTTLRIKAVHSMLFERWRGRPFTTWLFSASKDLAANRLEEIREDLKRHPELRRLLDEKRGNKLELRLTNGSWIKASSVGSAIRGEHPARIILDDVLDDLGDTSDSSVRHWFRKKLTPMLSPDTSIFCVGTPFSHNDLYHTEMLSNDAWCTWLRGSITNYDEWRSNDDIEAECLWPEQRPLDFLLEQKKAMGDLAFSQEYLCRVVDDESAAFPPSITRVNMDMARILSKRAKENGKYSIGFDPSHGIGQDFSVMVALRRDDEGFIHFLNIWRRNDFSPMQQTEEIIRWNDAYRRPIFASEDVGFQRLYESLLTQKKAHIDFRPSKVSNRALKQGLLSRVRAVFEQGLIVWPYGDDESRRVCNLILEELETHAWEGGYIVDKGRHNDCVMAFAHALDQLIEGVGGSVMLSDSASMDSWKGKKQTGINRRPRGRFVPFGG